MITVANKYHKTHPKDAQDIMRPNVLGNPYSHMEGTRAEFKVATREDAVAAYKPWLKKQMNAGVAVRKELQRLSELAQRGELVLLCCCAPKSCHGDAVKEALAWILANPEWTPKALTR